MRRPARSWCIAGVLAGAAACGGGGSTGATGEQSRGTAEVGGEVISTVHGFPITVGEVQALVDESDLSPREALRRLQAERLLMGSAEQRGFSGDPEVNWVKRQAVVQALLDRIASTATVTEEELREAYEKAGKRFGHPELRAVVHVLARLPKSPSAQADAAAKAYAQQMIGELARAEDPAALAKGVNGQKRPEFAVVGEALPPVPNDKRLEAPFIAAVYAAQGPGVIETPVRTSFGWHAMRVVQIIPEERTPFEVAAEELRPELLLARRTQLVDELIERVRKEQGTQRPANVIELLATLPP